MEDKELYLTFTNAPKINGEFIYNPNNLTQTFVNLDENFDDCTGVYFLSFNLF